MWSDNETDLDFLGFQHLVGSVCSVVRNDSLLPATIGVFGDWGSGKSSLLNMVRESLSSDKDTLVLPFNGWLFEGYDDAKNALMGTIIDEIIAQRSMLEGVSDKARGLAVRLLAKIQVFRLLGTVTKFATGYALGGLPAATLAVAPDTAAYAAEITKSIGELYKAGDEVTIGDMSNLLKKDGGLHLRKTVREFRDEFEKLLKESKISRLVVVIDDLDRCMPDTIIETLEAIKLFLFVPRTAFILGADERLVRYAVRRRFPELPGERAEVGRDYLEKLIQFPVRVPPLGRTEMETYINMLFTRKSLPKEADFEIARKCVVSPNPESLLDVRFNVGIAKEKLKDKMPEGLSESLELAQRIAPVLSVGLLGNPRQCKRFLNMLMMRIEMATSRGVMLKQRVLAKLMLLEYFRPESFKKLAEAQARQDGKPKELAAAEKSVLNANAAKGKKGGGDLEDDAGGQAEETWLNDSWVKDWISIDPPLGAEPLASYFYFSRDTLGATSAATQRMSPLAQEIASALAHESDAIRLGALKKVGAISPVDAAAIFESITVQVSQEQDLSDSRGALGQLCELVQAREDLISQALTFLGSVREDLLPAWIITRVEKLGKSDGHKPGADQLIAKWGRGTNESIKKLVLARGKKKQE